MNSEIQFERTGRAVALMLLLALILPAGCARPMPGAVDVSDDSVALLSKEFESSGGAAVVAVAAPEPDGFATLRGRFVLKGTLAGTLAALSPDKDLEVCGANVIPNESLVVGSDNGIQNMMIYVDTNKFKIPVEDPKWVHQEYLDTMNAVLEGAAAFDQKECRFVSHVFAMRASQTLQILNSDTVGHNANLQQATGETDGPNINSPGGSNMTYEPGGKSIAPFKVGCNFHPWMSAYLHISDHPFFAVSGEDGSFEIKHVPSGVELEFKLWHESASRLSTATINDPAAQFSRGKLNRTFSAGEEVDWIIEIDAAKFSHLFK